MNLATKRKILFSEEIILQVITHKILQIITFLFLFHNRFGLNVLSVTLISSY